MRRKGSTGGRIRKSYPHDKPIPMMKKLGWRQGTARSPYRRQRLVWRKTLKDMHKTKQRQYNKRLCKEEG